MGQARRKSADEQPIGTYVTRGLREAALFLLAALALYLLLALFSYSPTDPGWSHSGVVEVIANGGGRVGAWFADVFLYLFGYLAYLFPIMVAISGLIVYRINPDGSGFDTHLFAMRWSGFLLTLAGGCGLASLHLAHLSTGLPLDGGGVLGQVVGGGLVGVLSPLGSSLFLFTLFMIGVTFFTGLSWLKVMDATGRITLELVDRSIAKIRTLRENLVAHRARKEREETVKVVKERKKRRTAPKIEIHKPKPKVEVSERVEKERQVQLFDVPNDGTTPPLALLDEEQPFDKGFSPEVLEAMSRQLELKLADFGIEVEVTAVHPGPVITRFEMMPAAGVKVSRITNLAKDLARSLSVISVRVVEVIPGKSVIGIEIPNEHREMVVLSEILKSRDYDKAGSPLTLALGKDIGGLPSVTDLAKMPHLLVAGTTGSGKSVAVNAMILSLLYKSSPRDARMILIDPKMLELSVYEGIPHLLTPVVTDMKEAANGLRWCVGEMERRYKLMAALGVRNIAGYNRKVKDAEEEGTPIPDPLFKPEESMEMTPPSLEHLPYIVVVVDEFADMMMVVGKKVEELIARLAQKARAAGIHLILATQRPSVDVITGLIKANIPTRIAFQVSTKIDSRTILDQGGAEQLLGHGDMLYLAPGTGLPVRIHGAFVSDQEVHRVVDNLKANSEPQYLEEILEESSDPSTMLPGEAPAGGDAESDPLYDEAVRIVTETRRASISGVQRRLKIGYNRAARMIEDMELAGIVGELQSNGSREVLAPPPPKN
ncbi:cell division protein FtsK [Solemya pervernicosa gill symbiont]|uniref:DNA translocase FtsK n=2 Tax=Gammaproteobacteria incertae sedis TaxID=118884 RepID=A0A1T2L1Y1_9GAMM|nr:DNA translocase FtsK [Candidatus Reidiella endopervernicosa]OOZ39107.1 cell division protein FtsK [Solemya pervernicosa gill symbiont]QKQ26735.1 DNA translocase FtsK 4TM domain-containing protein [Candidatus Reidiella endopervernicosa]